MCQVSAPGTFKNLIYFPATKNKLNPHGHRPECSTTLHCPLYTNRKANTNITCQIVVFGVSFIPIRPMTLQLLHENGNTKLMLAKQKHYFNF